MATDTKPKHETVRFMGGLVLQVDHETKTCTIRFDTRAPRQYSGRASMKRYIQAARDAAKQYAGYEVVEHTNSFLYGRPGEDD